jgi:hypothetical protein
MSKIVTHDDADYAYDIVKTICTEVGPGMPGSSQERERAGIIKRELESHLGVGNVVIEEFTVAPWAMLSALPLSALFMLIAALLNISMGRFTGVAPWLNAVAALAFSIFAPLPFIFMFVLNYELVDPFFRKKQSVNVIGTLRKPGTKSVKRLLILGGHHDSAPENTWFGLLGNVNRLLTRHRDPASENTRLLFLSCVFFLFTATWAFGFITVLAMSIIQLAGVIAGSAGIVRIGTLGWVPLVYPIVPAVVFGLFFNRGGRDGGTVPGAADNLSASALAVAMCRFLVRNPSHFASYPSAARKQGCEALGSTWSATWTS